MSKRGPDRSGSQSGGFSKRRSHGKPMIKMLCPYYCAGAIIGKGGETIKELMDKTECDVKISKNDERFPTTSERVISVQGDQSSVEECILFCQDKIRKDQPPPNAKSESHAINAKRKEACKLVVSDTSAGRIIGKGGQRIKDMKNDYSVDINITRKDELPQGFDERCVSVEGEEGNVDNCVKEIIKLVCEDESASMEWHVFYNDWSDYSRRDSGRDSGRDRDGYGSGRHDSFGGGRDYGRDPYDDRRGGYDDRSRGYDDRKGISDRDGYGRDSYGGGRRDSYSGRDSGVRDYGRDSGRDYRDDRIDDRGYGGRDSYSARDSYGGGRDRDVQERDRGYGGRDSGFRDGGFRDDRRDDYGRNDSFGGRDGGRDTGRGDSFGGGRDSYTRDSRDGNRSFGGYNDRRENYRDEPRGGRY